MMIDSLFKRKKVREFLGLYSDNKWNEIVPLLCEIAIWNLQNSFNTLYFSKEDFISILDELKTPWEAQNYKSNINDGNLPIKKNNFYHDYDKQMEPKEVKRFMKIKNNYYSPKLLSESQMQNEEVRNRIPPQFNQMNNQSSLSREQKFTFNQNWPNYNQTVTNDQPHSHKMVPQREVRQEGRRYLKNPQEPENNKSQK